MKTIVIMIAPDGQSRLETNGYIGSGCRQASRFLEEALGQTTSEQRKDVFHQVATEQQQRASE
ncbi:DUF2997 domain-containing protein [Stieleria sp. TO1_6]|uniref:DUF2997 domain-containing protein n=1 Tax=Stieleria tagensis TaxID=2956795 RepID=UPI00209B2DD0|nr:DUF2997 domain-containing protein [Stieleria tagensis]MCO8123882.1 DUF2997 domain-containing protein [Stieleria tagensis]